MKTCQGRTKNDKPCRAPAGPGGLCFFHANPDRAKELGQAGGRGNRRSSGVDLEMPNSMTAAGLRDFIAEAIRSLLDGDLQAREAIALVQLCNLYQRLITTSDLEKRISKLEEALQPEIEPKSPADQIDSQTPKIASGEADAERDLEAPVASSEHAGLSEVAETSLETENDEADEPLEP